LRAVCFAAVLRVDFRAPVFATLRVDFFAVFFEVLFAASS
jgi:hypothetical protein